MDGTGEVSGWLGRLRRAFDFTLMDQLVDFATYERALRDGRAVVMVHVHGDEPKAKALDIVKRHGGHFINYYGRFATEELGLWHGPSPTSPAISADDDDARTEPPEPLQPRVALLRVRTGERAGPADREP